MMGVSSGRSYLSLPIDDVLFSIAGRLGLTPVPANKNPRFGFITLGGGIKIDFVFVSSSPLIDTPESLGLNLRDTVAAGCSKASARGLTSSKMGGSAGEKADVVGVKFVVFVDNDESDELEEWLKSGNVPNAGLGVRESANPDF
jgi:hypothetical protein